MHKKTVNLLTKLWKSTAFHCFSQPGKNQCQFIIEGLQNIIKAYNTFEKAIQINLQQIKSKKLNIPALAQIRNQIVKSHVRTQKHTSQQSQNLNIVFNDIGQLRFIMQKSQLNATKQYSQMINYFINQKQQKITTKKIQKIHDDLMTRNYKQKEQIRNNPQSLKFYKWITDFYMRSQQFFLKAYSEQWKQKARIKEIPFVRIKLQQLLNSSLLGSSSQSQPISQEDQKQIQPANANVGIRFIENLQQKMEDQENDIVSQIFKEYQKSYH